MSKTTHKFSYFCPEVREVFVNTFLEYPSVNHRFPVWWRDEEREVTLEQCIYKEIISTSEEEPKKMEKEVQKWDTATRGPQMADPNGMTIFKYRLEGDKPTLELPRYAQIIRTEKDEWGEWIWAIIDTRETETETRYFERHRIPALEEFTIFMNKDHDKVLNIQHFQGFTYMWIETDENTENRYHTIFRAFKTGAQMPDNILDNFEYVGFYPLYIQMELGLYVFKEA